jgi:acyl-CoA synthetase (AMP-forming)/AMP-acid ligase II
MGGCQSNNPKAKLPKSTSNVPETQLSAEEGKTLKQVPSNAASSEAATPPPTAPAQLFGLMQERELLVSSILEFAERYHAQTEIVSKRVEGDLHRYTFKDMASRSKQAANALDKLSLKTSDRVSTLAWNGYRHLELYYAVSGTGKVLHTLNPRLPPDQLAWIINHAEDNVLFFDLTFTKLVQAVHSKCPTITHYIALCDGEALPKETGIPNLHSYEEWISKEPAAYSWPSFDEKLACTLCYTSGTTGNPKGVLYSHRSTLLHAMAGALPDALNISARDVILPVVPMFHVNAWGIVYSALMAGAKLVFCGASLDGKTVYNLIESEKVTFAAGVPTVWQMLLAQVQADNSSFSTLKRTVIGGSACPPAMLKTFKNVYNVDVLHAWGMTEMSPLGSVCTLKNEQLSLPEEEQMKIKLKQGRPPFGVEMKIVDEAGAEVAWNGTTSGELLVRGPWIVKSYFKGEGGEILHDGWFPTGDVANIDNFGFMQITDR